MKKLFFILLLSSVSVLAMDKQISQRFGAVLCSSLPAEDKASGLWKIIRQYPADGSRLMNEVVEGPCEETRVVASTVLLSMWNMAVSESEQRSAEEWYRSAS